MIPQLLGGIGLFLLGMWLMTDGLKLAAGNALQAILRSATSSPLRGIAAGILITAVVQSSSAVTVATIGFVNAGLLNLAQSVWVIFGTNVGTTSTSWLVAAIGIKLDIVSLALPLLGIGALIRLGAIARPALYGAGQAVAGLGAFFLGVGLLQQGFAGVGVPPGLLELQQTLWIGVPVLVLAGAALTVLTQSSSAAIAIILTASAGIDVPLELAAAAVIGAAIGTTSTAMLAALAATPPAKRVAAAHVVFNLLTASAAIVLLIPALAASRWIVQTVGGTDDIAVTLAVFHTLFMIVGLLLVWPLAGRLVGWLEGLFVSLDEEIGRPRHLDATLPLVPQLALNALVLETERMSAVTDDLVRAATGEQRANLIELTRRHDGVLRLGQEVRTFIGQMNAGALSPGAAAAIPDIIRGVQHLENTARFAIELARDGDASRPSLEGVDLQAMRRLVIALLDVTDDAEDELRAAEQIEELYQSYKAALLHAVAVGQLHVGTMERTLLHIQKMRRCARAVHKSRRRLWRWKEGDASDIERAEGAIGTG